MQRFIGIVYTNQKLDNGNHSISIVCKSRFKFIPWLVMKIVVLRFAVFREVYWRIKQEIEKDRDFSTDEIDYIGKCRFSYGKRFGKWHEPEQPNEPLGFGFPSNSQQHKEAS